MKRIATILLVLVCISSLFGCSSASASETEKSEPTQTMREPTEEELSTWGVYYVPDTDNTTSYIMKRFTGSFYNKEGLGVDSYLHVYVFYLGNNIVSDNDIFAFRLVEEGNNLATYTEDDLINMSISIDDNNEYYIECFGLAPNGDVYLSSRFFGEENVVLSVGNKTDRKEVYNFFLNALREGKTVDCLITISDDIYKIYQFARGNSLYGFKIDGNGFAEQEAIAFGLVGCGAKTLSEITSYQKGGGSLRQEVDEYTTVEVAFYGEEASYDGQTNCCIVTTLHYKDNPASPSGKLMDPDATEVEIMPCTFDEIFLTLNGIDNYTYSVEKEGKYEYVVFSKPFLGYTKWYVDKFY